MESINSVTICKYKNFDINKLNIYDFDIKYENNSFYIQGPVFTEYELINHKEKKYIELKLNEKKNTAY